MANTPAWLGKDDLTNSVEQKGNWIKWGKVGDGFKGILVSREMRPRKNFNTGAMEQGEVFEFSIIGGEYHEADKKGNAIEPGVTLKEGSKYFCDDSKRIGAGMRDIRVGDEVIILFESTQPNKDPKFQDPKIIKVRFLKHHSDWVAKTAGVTDPEPAGAPDLMAPDFGA